MLMLIMLTLHTAYAGAGEENKPKSNPETEKKSNTGVDPSVDKVISNIPKEQLDVPDVPGKTGVIPYFEPSFTTSDASTSGEDQNAVLSFNVIQYIFQRFKFSEEGY